MDSIGFQKITASSVLSGSSKNKATEQPATKSIDTNDSFVKSSETQSEKKLDFVKKADNQPLDIRDGKLFLKDIAVTAGVGALVGCVVGGGLGLSPIIATGIGAVAGSVIGGIMGGATAVDRAKEKALDDMPTVQHSVDYQTPIYKTEKVFMGQIPTDYYVDGKQDHSKETPLKDVHIKLTNPVLDADGKPKMKETVLTEEGKGTPSVSWKKEDIVNKTSTMVGYNESVNEKSHYNKVFSHYITKSVISGYDYHGNPIYKTITEPVFNNIKVVDGYQHSFSPDIKTKTEKIGEYKLPEIDWKQEVNLDETSLKIRDSLVGAGLGAASGAIAGTLMALATPYLF